MNMSTCANKGIRIRFWMKGCTKGLRCCAGGDDFSCGQMGIDSLEGGK